PLHSLRDQLRRRVDLPLAELERRRDGEVVTVGGIVSTLRQLTTKKGESKLIALEVSEFEPNRAAEEVRLKLDARTAPAGIVRELSGVVRGFPGPAKVVLSLETSDGPRVLELGPGYRVSPVPDFYAEVKALLGEAAVS